MLTRFKQKDNGFTIIELTLAMTMLSILLIIILMSILNITGTYNKGLTLKRVNQSGRTISTELQANLRKSTPSGSDATATSNIGSYESTLVGTQKVLTRLCTGHDSFVWNVYGDDGIKTSETYSDGISEVIGMVKVSDTNGTLCKGADPPGLPGPEKSASKNLLDDGLIVRRIADPTDSSKTTSPLLQEGGSSGRLIKFTFTISTPDDNGLITAGSCQGGKEGDFCALNTFVVTSYAKGI